MIEKTIKGIKYRLDEENLTAEVLQKKGYEGDFIIPETVVFKKVAYRVTSIGEWAFANCDYITSITFNGTKAQWKGINLGEDWNDEVPTEVIHCTDGEVEI